MATAAAIEVDDLTVSFNGKSVLDGFSAKIECGERVALAGKSGSGKSTVLRCILGFVVPEKGRVRVEGVELTGESVWQLRTRVAYVAQEPDLGFDSVKSTLEQPFSYKANEHLRENLSRIPELLEHLLLPKDLLEKEMTDLSGGEKQRIALISALLLDREILLLDEASSALDEDARNAMSALLKAKDGLTVLSISHDKEWAAFSDRSIELPGRGGGGDS